MIMHSLVVYLTWALLAIAVSVEVGLALAPVMADRELDDE